MRKEKIYFSLPVPAQLQEDDYYLQAHVAGSAYVWIEPNEYSDIDGNHGTEVPYVDEVEIDHFTVSKYDENDELYEEPVDLDELKNKKDIMESIYDHCLSEYVRICGH